MRPLPPNWPRSRGWITLWRLGGAVCHQRPDRSFHIKGRQMPLCARCTGIYISFFFSFIAGLLFPLDLDFYQIAALLVIGELPMLIDGMTQYSGWRESTNILRLITGSMAGGVLGYLLGSIFGLM